MFFNVFQYILGAVLAGIVLLCVVLTIKDVVKKRKSKPVKANPVEVKDNVRYTPTDEIKNEEGDVKVSYVKEDIILQPRKMVQVGKKCAIKPGKYTVLSAYENEAEFNIRIGNFVKSYQHGQEIVLVEGDEVCPTSSTIILR